MSDLQEPEEDNMGNLHPKALKILRDKQFLRSKIWSYLTTAQIGLNQQSISCPYYPHKYLFYYTYLMTVTPRNVTYLDVEASSWNTTS